MSSDRPLTSEQEMQLAIDVGCSLRTIERAYEGNGARMSWQLICAAAKKRKFKKPPAPAGMDGRKGRKRVQLNRGEQ